MLLLGQTANPELLQTERNWRSQTRVPLTLKETKTQKHAQARHHGGEVVTRPVTGLHGREGRCRPGPVPQTPSTV